MRRRERERRMRMTGRAYISRVVRGRRASEGDSSSKEEGGQSAGPLYRKAQHRRRGGGEPDAMRVGAGAAGL